MFHSCLDVPFIIRLIIIHDFNLHAYVFNLRFLINIKGLTFLSNLQGDGPIMHIYDSFENKEEQHP